MPIIRSNICPCCGFESDAATAPQNESLIPKEGDLSLCIKCGGFLQYGKDLILNKIPDSCWDNMDQEMFDILLKARQFILNNKQ